MAPIIYPRVYLVLLDQMHCQAVCAEKFARYYRSSTLTGDERASGFTADRSFRANFSLLRAQRVFTLRIVC